MILREGNLGEELLVFFLMRFERSDLLELEPIDEYCDSEIQFEVFLDLAE